MFVDESETSYEQLIDNARAGSHEALGELAERCRDYLALVARQQMPADLQAKLGASDLVQETFLQAHRDFGQFAGHSRQELLAWFRRIVMNNLADAFRRYKLSDKRDLRREIRLNAATSDSEPGIDLPAQSSTASSHFVAAEQYQLLRQALDELGADYREVVLLRHAEGLAFDTIGERLGRSGEAARKLWGRAIQELQKHRRLRGV